MIVCAAWLPCQADDDQTLIQTWKEAQVGQTRAELVRADLEACAEGSLPALQKAAYDFFMEEMRAYRGQSGEQIALGMHRRALSTWSMICLSGSQLRTGQVDLALETVRVHLAQIEGSAPKEEVRAVWDRLGLVARGAGMREVMLDALGHSLAMGSEDALQLLGWEELSSGNWDKASRLFLTSIDRASNANREPAPWALPGWGLSLLEDMGK